jgi:hypothetical protein
MSIFSRDNILVTAEIEKKKAKGKGINEILTLMKELIAFQEKVEACIGAQDVSEHKEKIETFDRNLDEMYDLLVEIVSGGVRSVRENRLDELSGIADGELEEDVEEPLDSEVEVLDEPGADFGMSELSMPEVSHGSAISRPILHAPRTPRMP